MAKFICLVCGWKGDDVKEHESETSDIRLAKPNYPRIAKTRASPEKTMKDEELDALKKEVAKLKEAAKTKEPKTETKP